MSIKPQFEHYRYVGEICRLQSQYLVECRLPGSEISGILAAQAKIVPAECACSDGVVHYSGKALLSIVYEDGNRKICRAERGVEFFHKAEGEKVSPACMAKARLTAENVTWRREGSGLYLSAIVDANLMVYGEKQMEYLLGGDGLIVKKEEIGVYKTICVNGETEAEDEFETDYVGDILLHSERAVVNRVTAGGGQVELEGELALNICVLKNDDSVCSYERLIPFSMQVPCDEAFGSVQVGARVNVKSAFLTAGTDEMRDKSKMVLSYCLAAECYLCAKEEFSVASDAFSTANEIALCKKNDGGMYLTNYVKCAERVSGTAVLSPMLEGEYTLQAAVLPRAELQCRKGENGMEAEGVVFADVLLVGTDGAHRAAKLSLPVAFPVPWEGAYAEADCIVCGLNIRRKKNGETEAEATLKLGVRCYDNKAWEYISEMTEGEAFPADEGAFSVFLTEAGEDLWQVAKRLNCPPDELQKSNAHLQFPLKEKERIFVYRQIK